MEMTLGASGCDQCMGSVGVVIEYSQRVVDLLDYLVMKYPTSLVSVLFGNLVRTFCSFI